jgi:hypothetical protein
MPVKKLPTTDKERTEILQAIIDREELIDREEAVLSLRELHELRNFLLVFEGTGFCFEQAVNDEDKADKSYFELFKSAQLYISHFIQVLNLAVIRNEIKTDNLFFYGIGEDDYLTVPDLSTEEAVLNWGERIIKGESERTFKGGAPIYNPPIAKVKVHYDLFKEALLSLKIYRKNTIRNEEGLSERRERADAYILDIWERVENKFCDMLPKEKEQKYSEYKINYHYQKGEQLSVFG